LYFSTVERSCQIHAESSSFVIIKYQVFLSGYRKGVKLSNKNFLFLLIIDLILMKRRVGEPGIYSVTFYPV